MISSTVNKLAVSDLSRLLLNSVVKLIRLDAFEFDLGRRGPVRSSIDSDSDIEGNVTGGSNCGFESKEDSFSKSSPVRITDRPSSVDIDTRGGSSPIEGAAKDRLSGIVELVEIVEFRLEDTVREGDIERCAELEPWVLVLNREGRGGVRDSKLSLFSPLTLEARSIMLCRALRSIFLSVNGKYSVRCVVINSLGGRWPKKLRSFEGFFEEFADGSGCFGWPWVGDALGSRAFSGSRTPRPLRTLIVLARLIARAFWPCASSIFRTMSESDS